MANTRLLMLIIVNANIVLQTLNRSESMVSLCFRSLVGFVNEDNLQGLQSFLENKQIVIDDKDEVSAVVIKNKILS